MNNDSTPAESAAKLPSASTSQGIGPDQVPSASPRTAPDQESPASACDDFYESVRTDIHDMLDFIRAEGKAIPEQLRAKISQMCYGIQESTPPNIEDPTKSQMPPAVSSPVSPPVKADAPDLSLALEIHGMLSQIVAPANPRTIRASRLTGKYKFSADNTTVKLLLWISICSLVTFLGIAILQAGIVFREAQDKKGNGDGASVLSSNAITTASSQTNQPSSWKLTEGAPSPLRTEMDIFMLLAAASLGSAFYGLYTAHKYVVSCTFDPKYHQVYLIRFVLGLTSGTILGFFGKDFNLGLGGDAKKQLGACVLALVGGYAAEAVSQILQRFAETLVTVVRGSNTDVLEAKEGELKAKAKQQEAQTKNDLVKGLLKAKEAAITSQGAGSSVANEIQKTIDSISK